MLILIRQLGEAIMIGENIRVSVQALNAPRHPHDGIGISIGIEAPTEVKVLREELTEMRSDESRRR